MKHSSLTGVDVEFRHREYERLIQELEKAAENSDLQESPAGHDALNALFIQIRWKITPEWTCHPETLLE